MTDSVEEQMVMNVEEFSNDAQNVIENMGIRTMGELANTTEKELRRMRYCDSALVRHIKDVLKKYGLRLRPAPLI